MLAVAEAFLLLIILYLLSLTTYKEGARWVVSWILTGMTVLSTIAFGAYEPIARFDLDMHRQRAAVAVISGILLSYLYFYIFDTAWISPLYAVVAGLVAFSTLTISRAVAQKVAQFPILRNRVALLGENVHMDTVVNLITKGGSGVSVAFQSTLDAPGLPDTLLQLALDKEIHEIIVTSKNRPSPVLLRALFDCKSRGISVIDDTSYLERETGQVDLDRLYPHALVFGEGFQIRPISRFLKRVIDLVISGTALVILLPVFIIAAIAIRLDSEGEIFYRQTRTGLYGKPFEICKFRSMRPDAETPEAPQWAQEQDPRITKVGRFLRKTRIDELPQLINILMGEMSIVGPRPERPYFVEKLSKEIPFYEDRHRIKPGLTGWAQINYRYGASTEDAVEKLKYDLFYMKNFSVVLDGMIMLKTARVILWPDGVH